MILTVDQNNVIRSQANEESQASARAATPQGAQHVLLIVCGTALCIVTSALPGCGNQEVNQTVAVPDKPGAVKMTASVRAQRRAYDGAPPVIPHQNFGMSCTQCHTERGMAVPDVGFAPPSPHEQTAGLSAMSNCKQCHVFATTSEEFVENDFVGLAQDMRSGRRLNDYAPPVLPHRVFMRENCAACHTGPAAREDIRCTHPERTRCQQCHVPADTSEVFERRESGI